MNREKGSSGFLSVIVRDANILSHGGAEEEI
jgi:hypothetical protein